jgi:hypothetical protein
VHLPVDHLQPALAGEFSPRHRRGERRHQGALRYSVSHTGSIGPVTNVRHINRIAVARSGESASRRMRPSSVAIGLLSFRPAITGCTGELAAEVGEHTHVAQRHVGPSPMMISEPW